MLELTDFDELQQEQGERKELSSTSEKSIADVTLSDVHFKLNTDKTYEEQAKDVVNAMATAEAIKDDKTVATLAEGKRQEIIGEQSVKVTKTQQQANDAKTDLAKSEYSANETVLKTFMVFSHLPKWLQNIVMGFLTPFYLLFVLIVNVPCGFVKMLIDGIDGIICRYERADERTRPRIKVTVWIIFGFALALTIALGVLGGLNII